jgi:hypothetical protein
MITCYSIRTNCLVPGDPQDVKATPINSTTIHVSWKPPQEKDKNGIIRGYHIHVQEMKEEVREYICLFQYWFFDKMIEKQYIIYYIE